MPSSAGRRGRPWNNHRATLGAIAWRFRTGAPWRDIPPELGAWQSIWERHQRWSTDGTYEAAMFAAVRAHRGGVEDAELAALWADPGLVLPSVSGCQSWGMPCIFTVSPSASRCTVVPPSRKSVSATRPHACG